MSSNHSIYYGVYLVGEGKRQIEVDGNQACPHGHSGVFSYKDNFCRECGTALVFTKTMETISFSDIVHEQNDNFVIANYCTLKERKRLVKAFENAYVDSRDDVLIPNDLKIFGVCFNDDDGAFSLPVPTKKVMSLPEVRKLLADDIKLLRKTLYKKVTVKFGCISTWN